MNIPNELMYTNDHEWTKFEDNKVKIGITDFAQGELGDVIFVELPEVGLEVGKDEAFGTIESIAKLPSPEDQETFIKGYILPKETEVEDEVTEEFDDDIPE